MMGGDAPSICETCRRAVDACATCPENANNTQQTAKIIAVDFVDPSRHEADMADAILEAIAQFTDRVSVAQVIGVLEIVKIGVLETQG